MSRAGAANLLKQGNKNDFRLSSLFPEHPPGSGQHKPFPKQDQIFSWTRSGEVRGGGIVYQSGKGGGKTLCGGAWIIWMHHVPKWQGCTTVIGRESYPSLCMSTGDEFFRMVNKLPDRMIKAASKPNKNTYGYVEWAVGGTTLLISLSNSDTWESANLGAAWVDEAHRQNPRIVGDLETRLRQIDAPRVMLCTTNPAGKGWLYKIANPESKEHRENWRYLEASSMENPALPPDYTKRLIQKYGFNTPAYKRWVLGQSSALEGSVFTEFDSDVNHCLHVVPPMDLPQEWLWGRGLDYGMVNPTAVSWGARDHQGNLWIDFTHYAPEKPEDRDQWDVPRHAEIIKDIDARYKNLKRFPADPSIFAQIHTNAATGVRYSTADSFYEHGVTLYPADNNRESGLSLMLDLVRVDPERCHPVSLQEGSPRLFILDRECNEPVLREFENLLWARPDGTAEAGRPDDVRKKDDHTYDEIRYLAMDDPSAELHDREPTHHRDDEHQVVGSRGRTRRY